MAASAFIQPPRRILPTEVNSASGCPAMCRLVVQSPIRALLGLTVAFGIGATRSEKLIAELYSCLPHEAGVVLSTCDHAVPEPFDPARVPVSGGMAARLLAGISVRLA